MNIFTKIKLTFWFLFNKKKYKEYIDLLRTKLYIFNKFYIENDIWHILTITTDGEIIHHFGIKPDKLEETIQFFTQEIKLLYNEKMTRDYELITIMPNDEEPVLFRRTADKILVEREKQRELNPSAFDDEHFLFD